MFVRAPIQSTALLSNGDFWYTGPLLQGMFNTRTLGRRSPITFATVLLPSSSRNLPLLQRAYSFRRVPICTSHLSKSMRMESFGCHAHALVLGPKD